eukprot:293240-Pyramimonas_sp.AAC.2
MKNRIVTRGQVTRLLIQTAPAAPSKTLHQALVPRSSRREPPRDVPTSSTPVEGCTTSTTPQGGSERGLDWVQKSSGRFRESPEQGRGVS